ncbi:uncharacterized protein LOC143237729 isoform X3 [Tachypleus tridentatus]|uniref:uncharacterized protein LOC143237729 isoform X3 n=1 Tax=Tachypleus tridentatus TaxID=6853 RepID=UPI003FD0C7C2
MEGDSKQRSKRCRRREQFARTQRQNPTVNLGRDCPGSRDDSGNQGQESPKSRDHSPTPQKTVRKKQNKEPIFEEDVIDGFAILSFKTLEDLENMAVNLENEKKKELTETSKPRIDCVNENINAESNEPSNYLNTDARVYCSADNENQRINQEKNFDLITQPKHTSLDIKDSGAALVCLTSTSDRSDYRINGNLISCNKQTFNNLLKPLPTFNSDILHNGNQFVEKKSRKSSIDEGNRSSPDTQRSNNKESCDKSVYDHPAFLQCESSIEQDIANIIDQITKSQAEQKFENQTHYPDILDTTASIQKVQNCALTSLPPKIIQNCDEKPTSSDVSHASVKYNSVKKCEQKLGTFSILPQTFTSHSVNFFKEEGNFLDSLYPKVSSHSDKHCEPKQSSLDTFESRILIHPAEKIKQKRIGVVDPTVRSQSIRNDHQKSSTLSIVDSFKQHYSLQKGEEKHTSLKLLNSKETFNSIKKCEKDPIILFPTEPKFRSKSEYLDKQLLVCTTTSASITSIKTTNSGSSVLQNRHPHLPPVGCVAPNPRSSASIQQSLRDSNGYHLTSFSTSSVIDVANSTCISNHTFETSSGYKEHSSNNTVTKQQLNRNHLLKHPSAASLLVSAQPHKRPSSTLSTSCLPTTSLSSTSSVTKTNSASSPPVSVGSNCSSLHVVSDESHSLPFNYHSTEKDSSSHKRTTQDCRSFSPVTRQDCFNGQLSNPLSSVNQLSQPLHTQEFRKENHSSVITSTSGILSSRHSIPCCTYTTASFGSTGLTNLSFSKPHLWTGLVIGKQASSVLASANEAHLAPGLPRPTPSGPSSTSLSVWNSHHSSLYNTLPGMFAPAIHPAVSLSSTNLSMIATPGPSLFNADSFFSSPSQDFLRRELDTRFLASHDRSINIPPPPYMRSEFHHHQHLHNHMHQHSPFLPPPLVPQPAAPLLNKYDKFPKIDASFYERNSLGLSSPYPGFAPLLGSGNTSFAPPSNVTTFQPKKSGRWCAMHVRIAWEIYNHQQHGSSGKLPPDLLRPPTHLLPSLARPHEFSPFASSLLPTSVSSHSRSLYEGSHANSFLTPVPHLGVSPFGRPGYPAFGSGPSSSYPELGPLGLGGRELATSSVPGLAGQDPWTRIHRNSHTFGPVSAGSNHIPWGGLKAEAERDRERMQQEERGLNREQEKEKHKKAEVEKERKEKETMQKSKELERERKDEDWQRERDREKRVIHQLNNMDSRHGEYRDRSREKENDQSRGLKEVSRSPIRNNSHRTENHSVHLKNDTKVKEEKRDDGILSANSAGLMNSISVEHEQTKSVEAPRSENSSHDYLPGSVPHHPHLNIISRTRTTGPSSVSVSGSSSDQMPVSLMTANTTLTVTSTATVTTRDPYRPLEYSSVSGCEREQLFQQYPLKSVMPFPPYDRFRESEHVRQLSTLRNPEIAYHMERDHHNKLHPALLRSNESQLLYASHGFPPFWPPWQLLSFTKQPLFN